MDALALIKAIGVGEGEEYLLLNLHILIFITTYTEVPRYSLLGLVILCSTPVKVLRFDFEYLERSLYETGIGFCFPFLVVSCLCKAWKEGESIFAWADKGDWVSKKDEDVDLDSRKFRIGFEPLFVDYTQRGTLYMSFVLFEWFVFGLVCGGFSYLSVVGFPLFLLS